MNFCFPFCVEMNILVKIQLKSKTTEILFINSEHWPNWHATIKSMDGGTWNWIPFPTEYNGLLDRTPIIFGNAPPWIYYLLIDETAPLPLHVMAPLFYSNISGDEQPKNVKNDMILVLFIEFLVLFNWLSFSIYISKYCQP